MILLMSSLQNYCRNASSFSIFYLISKVTHRCGLHYFKRHATLSHLEAEGVPHVFYLADLRSRVEKSDLLLAVLRTRKHARRDELSSFPLRNLRLGIHEESNDYGNRTYLLLKRSFFLS